MAHRLTGETMGTNWSVSWCAAPGLPEETVRQALEARFSAMIASMSPWEPSSLISRYNRLSGGSHIKVDPHFAQVIALALDVAHSSDGAFDPCLGGEVMRRGFGPAGPGSGKEGRVHGPAAWNCIQPEPGCLYQPGGVTLDVSAIAKGYSVDQMAAVMEGFGVTQFLVEIGGEFVGRGVKPDQAPWWVDLENPAPGEPPWRVAMIGNAMATSGDYRQQLIRNGIKLTHIVPAPARKCEFGDLASVTVIHASCALADAWATAIFAAGDKCGMALADRCDLAALLQFRDAPARMSARMIPWLD